MPLMFGHLRRHQGYLRHLMPTGFRVVGLLGLGQRDTALFAVGGPMVLGVTDPLGRQTGAMVAGMSGLPARLAAGGGFGRPFGGVRRITGGRHG